MKNKLKLVLGILVSFLIVSFFFKRIDSPQSLARRVKTYMGTGRYFLMAKIGRRQKQPVVSRPGAGGVQIVRPLVKRVEAKERITVFYKGEKLTFLVVDGRKPISKKQLEFFYKLKKIRESRNR